MALPDFDPLKHHIGLGPVGSPAKGYLLSGAYRVDPQQQGGSPEYGGENDVLTAGTLARWTQDDFSGGAFEEDARTDPAMFADSENLLPNLTSRSARTVPPLVFFAAAGNVDASDSLGVFATGGTQIVAIDSDKARFYDADLGTLVERRIDDPDTGLTFRSSDVYAAVHDPADNLVYLLARRNDATEASDQLNGAITAGATSLTLDSNADFPTNGVVRIGDETIYYRGKSGGTDLNNLQRGREGSDAAAHSDNAAVNFRRQFFLAKCSEADGVEWIGWIPNSSSGPPRGMSVTAGRDILVQMNSALWLLDVNDARDSLTAVRIGRLPGRWQDAVTYNGQTYLLLTDSEQHTSLMAWDGTQVLPVTPIPYNFLGSCVAEYAGRIYIGGRGRDLDDEDVYAELYEVSGASLRLVKSFGAEARAGRSTVPANFFSMVVHEGLLFLGTDIGELIAYDVTRDALWPGVKIEHVDGHVLEARFLLSTRQKLLAWCFDQDVASPDPGFYRMATSDEFLGSVAIGNTDAKATPFSLGADTVLIQKFTVGGDGGELDTLRAYMDGGGAGLGSQNFKGLVYEDNAGTPGDLVAVSAEVNILKDAAAAWVDFAFAGETILPGDYWIGLHRGTTASVARIYRDATGGTVRFVADTYADGPADPYSGGSTGVENYSMHIRLVEVAYESVLETSDFLPEPDRDKRWATVRLVTRYDNASLEVSQDGGTTWESVSGTTPPETDLKVVDYDLSGLDPSPAIRFRWTMGSSTVAYKEFVAFTCSFLWLDSGKQVWSMTILGADRPENVDGAAREQDVATLRSTLRGFYRNKTTLAFTDLDGEEYTVYMSACGELQPQIADALDEDGTREAFFSATLTEL